MTSLYTKSTITKRLLISYSSLILIFLLFGIFTLYGIHSISGLTRTIYNHPLVVSNAALQSNISITKMHRNMKDVVLFESDLRIQQSIAAVEQEKNRVYEYLNIVRDRILGEEGKKLENETRVLFDEWHPIRQEVIELVGNNMKEMAAEITIGKGAAHVAKLEEKMVGLTEYARNKATDFMFESEKTSTVLNIICILFLAVTFLISVIIALLNIRGTLFTEKELRKSELRFRTLTSTAPVGIFQTDAQGMGIYVNEAVVSFTGMTPDDHIGEGWARSIFPEDRERILKLWEKTVQGESFFETEFRFASNDGNITWVASKAVPITSDDGSITGFLGTLTDITKRQQTEEALRESEERYRVLFKSSSDSVFIVDIETLKIVDANEQAVASYGYSYEELLDLKAPMLSAEPSKTKNTLREDQDKIVPLRYHRRKDGSIFPVEITTNSFTLDKRKYRIGNMRDVSEIKNIEKRLNQAQKMESIGNLAGGIAHDFNNILSSILGFTELALDEAQKGSSLEDSLQEVHTAGKRARDLVKQILAFARQSEEERKPIKLAPIVDEVLRLIRSTVPTTIIIERSLESQSLIQGNPTQVHQMLMNLCTNAAHAMDESGGTMKVTVKDIEAENIQTVGQTVLPYSEYLEITVSDTGVGIPPDIASSIFEPYFTTKGVGEGTGMGLAMVQGIVETYEGHITCDSKINEGTTITIFLPKTGITERPLPFEPHKLPGGRERILFVDDEAPLAKMGERILSRLGYSVTTSTSSIKALDLFNSNPFDFDLIITDMTMPNMTGDQLAIEALKIRQDLPIILCTGYSRKISTDLATKIGIKEFTYKPIVTSDLAESVRRVLDENRSK